MNDLYENDSKMKNFLLMMHLFSMILDANTSATKVLNKDLEKINHKVFRGRMSINVDLSKQTQECLFGLKIREGLNLPKYFYTTIAPLSL